MSVTDRRRNLFELLVAPETREGFFAAVADDVQWTVLGTHPLAGTYSDKRSFLDATFGRLDRLRQGGMRMEIRGLYMDQSVVTAEISARATAIDGAAFDHDFAWVCRFEGEVIVEARAYLDSALVTDMIERLEPMVAGLASDRPEPVIQTGPRHEHERVYGRAADAAEAAHRPLEPKWRPNRLAASDDPDEVSQPVDPHHALNTPVGEADPTADSDPYREPSEDDSDQWASGTTGEGQGSEDG